MVSPTKRFVQTTDIKIQYNIYFYTIHSWYANYISQNFICVDNWISDPLVRTSPVVPYNNELQCKYGLSIERSMNART